MNSGKINICACLGPQYGDPYCICEMKQRGLTPSKSYDWTEEEKENLNNALAEMFKWKTKKEPSKS